MSSPTPEVQRLFFALWPDAALQSCIHTALEPIVGAHVQPTPVADLHITLVFLGSTPQAQRHCYEQVAASMSVAPFELSLQHIGHWPKPRILWLGPDTQPDALLALVQSLNNGLQACGYTPETRPYQAHMTLARKVSRSLSQARIEPIRWHVDHFALVASRTESTGVRYRVLETWPLRQR